MNTTPSVQQIKKLQARQFKRQVISTIGGWNSETVRTAIEQQSIGDFSQTSKLARKMMGDAVYSAAVNKRTQALVRSEFSMEPSEQDSEAAKLIADSTLNIWFDAIPELTVQTLLRNYLNIGVALAYTTWENKKGIWYPIVEVYDTEFLRYDQNSCKWLYRTSGPEVEVTPCDGNWILLSQWTPGQITGFVSQLGESWVNKKFAERDQAVGNEAHIDSVCLITDTGNGTAQLEGSLEDFAAEVQEQKRDRVFAVPAGYQVTFEDSLPSYKPEAFTNVISICDKNIRIAVLGGNLGSDVSDVGSFAATEVHNGIEANLTTTDATILSTELHKQLMTHVVDANYGALTAEEYSPWPTWKTTQDTDLSSEIKTLLDVKTFIGDSYKIKNLEEILTKFGIVLEPNGQTIK